MQDGRGECELDSGGETTKRDHSCAGLGGFIFVAISERSFKRLNKQLPKE